MADGSGAASVRYRAFISYSHRDAAFAGRLHRRLEGYVLPKRLGADRRLTPIFKDREELPAAHDLSTQVRAALAVSDCLIVVCSPDAAASPWVGREIDLFRELHPDRPILAALIRGEPAEAFPPALADGGAEPLAADFRKEADGERLALLKLIAGIAGVGVDQLVQRDAQRRLRGVMAVTGAAVAAMLAMGVMTTVALQARVEAERQRAEAEGLVEFMLTDLRDRLKGVGRLDVLTSVNRRALRYYRDQDLARLPPESLDRRARLLHAMGEDEANRDELDGAERLFDEAYRTTEALVQAEPSSPDRAWGHAQSAYWRGFLAYKRGRQAPAREAWVEYRRLAERLRVLQPGAVRTEREVAYAESNLCILAIELEQNPTTAVERCRQALDIVLAIGRREPGNRAILVDLVNDWAWMADAYVLAGDIPAAERARRAQLATLERLLTSDRENADLLYSWGGAQRALARIAFLRNDLNEARRRIAAVQATFGPLSIRDPSNALWRAQIEYVAAATKTLNDRTAKESPR